MKAPRFWYRPFGIGAALLSPLSLIYLLGRALHVALARPQVFKNNVICVGNLVAGGAGKTPTVLALAALLKRHGIAPQIVTRGFGGTVTAPHCVQSNDSYTTVGDEALLLAQAAPTWVAMKRVLGIGCTLAAGAQAVLLDDGLQSVRLRAGTNLLVIDGPSGFGNGLPLPAGPLRETVGALRGRIDAVILIGEDMQHCATLFPDVSVFRATPAYDLSAIDTAAPYLAFAGLARPEKVFAAAQALGLTLLAVQDFADHHPYSIAERQALRDRAQKLGAHLLTTAKDAMRWPVDDRAALTILPLQLRFTDEAALVSWLKARLDA